MPPKRASHAPSSIPITRQYLVLYNLISALLWSSLFLRIVFTLATSRVARIYPTVGGFARNTQTLALAEIVHAAIGVVRAPVPTTALQVASRLLLVWGVVDMFGSGLGLGAYGSNTGNQLAYTGMLSAWSLSEIVRYSYFVAFLGSGGNASSVPGFLTWARYNLFYVLYPVGISSEVWLLWYALPMAETWHPMYAWALRAVMVIYVPGKCDGCFPGGLN